MTVSISPEELQAATDRAVAKLLAKTGDLEAVMLLSTRSAANALELSDAKFLTLMKAHGIKSVPLGPRLTRWRYTDIIALVGTKR
jgi:predicted DNA-binding transcriptional regulator AlpA